MRSAMNGRPEAGHGEQEMEDGYGQRAESDARERLAQGVDRGEPPEFQDVNGHGEQGRQRERGVEKSQRRRGRDLRELVGVLLGKR